LPDAEAKETAGRGRLATESRLSVYRQGKRRRSLATDIRAGFKPPVTIRRPTSSPRSPRKSIRPKI